MALFLMVVTYYYPRELKKQVTVPEAFSPKIQVPYVCPKRANPRKPKTVNHICKQKREELQAIPNPYSKSPV
jgi:hypothetical protein